MPEDKAEGAELRSRLGFRSQRAGVYVGDALLRGDSKHPRHQSMRPLFILSLPRAGSTLLQRMLVSHEGVATTAEPWILLPLFYATNDRAADASYDVGVSRRAIEEFRQLIGPAAHDTALRDYVERLYELAAGERREVVYFLDKTPRYHLVVEQLLRTFPDARFIFLWRNPLSVAASIMNSWCHGRWELDRFGGDLFGGLARLCDGYDESATNQYALRFEDLTQDDPEVWSGLLSFLELDAIPRPDAPAAIPGSLGDKTGVRDYTRIDSRPMSKWVRTFANPLRRRWAREYLDWIGEQRLALMGYSLAGLTAELERAPLRRDHLLSDVVRMPLGRLAGIRRALSFYRDLQDDTKS